jgi:hypothetical protein
VIGTVDLKVWRKASQGSGSQVGEAIGHLADFKKYLDLHVEPGGRRPAGEK